MAEEGDGMKRCPACSKEIPANWNVCTYCGNIFRKSESREDAPSMFYWSDGRKRTEND